MKLKRLEITGFKSFMDRVVIEFPAGVSAIVGPNGCGKSNVVDALRWVMGEQSVKQLRGKAKEDVIFAGTSGKAPLNMAEVSLTLLNDDGTAPEELRDFTEIMITRRLYRSGESGYLLNKQPCRLKDIYNLLLGSGLGAKSYAVIGQGNIGAITDAGPEERRYFLEEAAGISRYKQRKKEALSKMESTEQNLLRVNDILSEVEKRMRAIKRQAKKAEKYRKYQERIQDLDIRLSIHRYDEYGGAIEESQKLLKDLKDAEGGQVSKLNRLDAAIEKIKLARTQKDEQIAKQKASRHETQRKIDKAENDRTHLKEEIERLRVELENLSGARAELSEKNRRGESEVVEAEAEIETVKAERDAAAAQLKKEKVQTDEMRAQLKALNREMEAEKNRLTELAGQEARYKNIQQSALNSKESLQRRLKRADEDQAVAQKKLAEADAAEKAGQDRLKALRQELSEIDEGIEDLRGRLEERRKTLSEQLKKVQTLEMERNKTRSRHSALKKMEENFEWFKDGVKAVMKRRGNNRGTRVIGLVADILEPEKGYETAVEAVMGEALQYVMVESREAAATEIGHLMTERAGRSGFIPLTGLHPAPYIPHEGEGIPLLSRVGVKPGYEALAQALLGHVQLTDDMENALSLYSRNGTGMTVVTRDGSLISGQGMMIGGSSDNLSGILAKKQEIRSLEAELETSADHLDAERKHQKRFEEELRELEVALQEEKQAQKESAADEMDAQKALYKSEEEHKHAKRHLEIVSEERDRLTDEKEGIEAEVDRTNRALERLTLEVEAAQRRTLEKGEEIEAFNERMEEFNQKTVDIRLRLTSLEARLENSTRSLGRLKEFLKDGLTRHEQIGRDIVIKEKRITEAQAGIEKQKHQLLVMYENMKHLDEALARNEAEYQSIESQLKENDASLSQIRKEREEALQKIRMIELDLSQQEMKQNHIAERVEERYNRSIKGFRETAAQQSQEEPLTPAEMEEQLSKLREKSAALGEINMGAIQEHEELQERFDFLSGQKADLVKAVEDLHKVIRKINRISQEKFLATFNLVNEKLGEVFPRLFEGGTAKLELTEPDKPLETGVEFMVHPPGKKLTRMSLLSGGEKALSAIAFIFSIFLIRPTSFCILDEIDAPLDEANVIRFNDLLRVIGENSQIVMITHKKKSMEFADMLFGITMEKKGISKLVSVNLERKGKEVEYGMVQPEG